eukprot:Amastigsp_a175743_247.p3 type:complete len:142 gc:universal Amastigsp_a175743_247:1054-629(-)
MLLLHLDPRRHAAARHGAELCRSCRRAEFCVRRRGPFAARRSHDRRSAVRRRTSEPRDPDQNDRSGFVENGVLLAIARKLGRRCRDPRFPVDAGTVAGLARGSDTLSTMRADPGAVSQARNNRVVDRWAVHQYAAVSSPRL